MKQRLKLEILEKREFLAKDEFKEKSKLVKENLFSLPEFKKSKNMMFYASFKNEVDTHEIIKELLAKKEKTVVIPYVLKNYPILQLSELKNFDWLEPKTFGVLEPRELYIRDFSIEKLDLIIVPGIVFDKKGYRVGYGHGYYDRFLKKIRKDTKKIGLAFDFQVVEDVPEGRYDVPVDIVVTEKRVLRCSK